MPWDRVGLVALGGALGANARYWLGLWITSRAGDRFPWATLAINVSGSFAAGFLSWLLVRWLPHPHWRLLIVTGLLGGYTTFSAFELEACGLWKTVSYRQAIAYLCGSVLAGFVAASLGLLSATWLAGAAASAPRAGPAVASGPAD
jgi:CrcB protein